jgi:hypothetical protein
VCGWLSFRQSLQVDKGGGGGSERVAAPTWDRARSHWGIEVVNDSLTARDTTDKGYPAVIASVPISHDERYFEVSWGTGGGNPNDGRLRRGSPPHPTPLSLTPPPPAKVNVDYLPEAGFLFVGVAKESIVQNEDRSLN